MRGRALLCGTVAALCLLAGQVAPAAAKLPPIKHVFIIVLENQDYNVTFGPDSEAPYLAQTLRSYGQLLTRYHAIGHLSLDNYIAMVSGQSPNAQTQADCQIYTSFTFTFPSMPIFPGPSPPAAGQAWGQGCVYPAFVPTIADQLQAAGFTWKGYMEDMGNDPVRDGGKNCAHPPVGQVDPTQSADVGDQYAVRHNPFVYFTSIIDGPYCKKRVVPLTRLPGDLATIANTPNYSFITPNLCSDGHDEPCVDGQPGGLQSMDNFLRQWVPLILNSPAFAKDGLLIVTFDESESGAESCCNEPTGPNTINNGGSDPGDGGGRVGAVLMSRYIRSGTTNRQPYNHYSLLRSIEDLFGLKHLGYARTPNPGAFGADVYNGAPDFPGSG